MEARGVEKPGKTANDGQPDARRTSSEYCHRRKGQVWETLVLGKGKKCVGVGGRHEWRLRGGEIPPNTSSPPAIGGLVAAGFMASREKQLFTGDNRIRRSLTTGLSL